MADGPVTTTYLRPLERVVFAGWRDANPFFHLFESIWMLSGRNDVAPLVKYVKDFGKFSDDGETLHGAYGHRWRQHFGHDQIAEIVQNLKTNKDCRRQVLGMWDPGQDLSRPTKDAPCNLMVTFQIDSRGELEMTIFCRSNDIILGAYGANVVHMSYLQEYIAIQVGVPVGKYHQISVNWHAYEHQLERMEIPSQYYDQRYDDIRIKPFPLITDINGWHKDIFTWWRRGTQGTYYDPFFGDVLKPMVYAHEIYTTTPAPDKFERALAEVDKVQATDWATAGREWIERRWAKWIRAQDDGPVVQDVPEVR